MTSWKSYSFGRQLATYISVNKTRKWAEAQVKNSKVFIHILTFSLLSGTAVSGCSDDQISAPFDAAQLFSFASSTKEKIIL